MLQLLLFQCWIECWIESDGALASVLLFLRQIRGSFTGLNYLFGDPIKERVGGNEEMMQFKMNFNERALHGLINVGRFDKLVVHIDM